MYRYKFTDTDYVCNINKQSKYLRSFKFNIEGSLKYGSAETYLEPTRTSAMEPLAKIV